MKRIIALCILAVMLLSFTSCKRAESDDDVAVVDKQNETVQTPADDTGKTQPTTENTQKEDTPAAENTKKEDTPAVEQDKVETKPSEEQETVTTPAVQKGEPCKLTINNTFSEYIVVATLTDAESAKNKTYTPADFPDLDVFLVFENNDYYNIKYYPEYETKTTLFLMLNTPSKQTVLDYIKLLEKDDRVYSAYGNVIEASKTEVEVTFKDNKQYTAQQLSVKEVNIENDTGITTLTLNEETTDIAATIKNLLSDSRIATAKPVINNKTYEHVFLSAYMKYEQALKAVDLTEKDFSFDILKLYKDNIFKVKEDEKSSRNYWIEFYLDIPSKQNIVFAIDEIKKKIEDCWTFVIDEAEYSGDRLLVTLTEEESALNKTYAPSDFPELNVSDIDTGNTYDNKNNLNLTIYDTDKLTLNESIYILLRDERVYYVTVSGRIIDSQLD